MHEVQLHSAPTSSSTSILSTCCPCPALPMFGKPRRRFIRVSRATSLAHALGKTAWKSSGVICAVIKGIPLATASPRFLNCGTMHAFEPFSTPTPTRHVFFRDRVQSSRVPHHPAGPGLHAAEVVLHHPQLDTPIRVGLQHQRRLLHLRQHEKGHEKYGHLG